MDDPTMSSGPPQEKYAIDVARLWIGGLMAGVVAAGVAIVGLLIVRGVLDIRVFQTQEGDLVNASSWWYALVSVAAALLATALLHLLLLAAPSPWQFFGWIMFLATAIAVIVPFTTSADLDSKIGTAAINLAIGIAIFSILSGVGRSATRRTIR